MVEGMRYVFLFYDVTYILHFGWLCNGDSNKSKYKIIAPICYYWFRFLKLKDAVVGGFKHTILHLFAVLLGLTGNHFYEMHVLGADWRSLQPLKRMNVGQL